jgi:hypothetical protein
MVIGVMLFDSFVEFHGILSVRERLAAFLASHRTMSVVNEFRNPFESLSFVHRSSYILLTQPIIRYLSFLCSILGATGLIPPTLWDQSTMRGDKPTQLFKQHEKFLPSREYALILAHRAQS